MAHEHRAVHVGKIVYVYVEGEERKRVHAPTECITAITGHAPDCCDMSCVLAVRRKGREQFNFRSCIVL